MRRELVYVPVCLGDEKWQLFSLCSNSSFHSLGLFFVLFFFQAFERSFFVNHLDFPVSIVAPKRFLEQSFFFSFSHSLSLSVSLYCSVCVCVCVCVSSSLSSVLFLSHSLPISFSRLCVSLSLSLPLFFSPFFSSQI